MQYKLEGLKKRDKLGKEDGNENGDFKVEEIRIYCFLTQEKIQYFKTSDIPNNRKSSALKIKYNFITERGRKTKIRDEQRVYLLKELMTKTDNSFPMRKKVIVKFLNEKQSSNEIPKITNHVKYPEYNRFKTLYEQNTALQNNNINESLQIKKIFTQFRDTIPNQIQVLSIEDQDEISEGRNECFQQNNPDYSSHSQLILFQQKYLEIQSIIHQQVHQQDDSMYLQVSENSQQFEGFDY